MARDEPETVRRNLDRRLSAGNDPLLRQLAAAFDEPAAALAAVREAFDDPAQRSTSAAMRLASFAAYFGDEDLVLRCMRRAYVELAPQVPFQIWHALYARARRSEGFKQLVRELGLYGYWRESGHWGDFARPLGGDDFEVIA